MCFAKTIYTCQHQERKRVTCRKTWHHRAGWCFRPLLLFFFGDAPEEPCSELRVNDTIWPNVICPECRTAEETGIATKGIVTSTTTTNKYREKLTPAALAASRRRKEEQDKEEEKMRTNYWSIQEDYQAGLRKRELEEAARLQGGDASLADGSENYADRPLPALPAFPAASVGDTRGDPGYQDPRLRSKNMFPPPPPPAPPPAPENKKTTKKKRRRMEPPVIPERQEGPYERPTKENHYGRARQAADEAIRIMKEADEPSPARQSIAVRRGREMKQLANSYREEQAAPWPEEPSIQRRPTPPPEPEPEKAAKKSGKRKGGWNPFGNKDRRDDVAH
ncbi:uncharacterized protein BDZ83DRAFT_747142 [Colletotrichum acutatum]|uniref:Uncharacterized protein n=1 Tax=Glomerella acutata TaxID=27357 RepID=A0AAD8XP12_GLOAC|nr:uncharacterized protein BDZ83DRAFT_747142 [Colletotrichum acutatum]KAK1730821.1 hypothetical protein BDZ83DRAFT_747142 [Colletotrichum acutatum]